MSVIVRCPYCGREFELRDIYYHRKGKGAWYSKKIKRLSRHHIEILRVLYKENRPLPKRVLVRILNEGGVRISGNALSGRLSELKGLGLVDMFYRRVKVYDKKSMSFRFRKKPHWILTEKGREKLLQHLGTTSL